MRIRIVIFIVSLFLFMGVNSISVAQDKELITKDIFVKTFSESNKNQDTPKLRLRGVSVVNEKSPQVTVQLLFKFGTTELADEFSRRQLHEIGLALSSDELGKYRFEIAGHTDSIGTGEGNQFLSEQRAKTIKQILCNQYKINDNRLMAKGYGESQPVMSNKTKVGRAKNRRVVIKRWD